MRHYLLLLVIGFTLALTSCRNDFEFETSSGGLEFSRDTVYLDTVFSNIGSSTYTLKVYNRSDKDIAIPTLKLKKADSKYRMMVDGMSGQSFNNVELMANDSLFIFIETTVDVAEANPDDFLYTDEIEFYSTNGVQEVHLVTLIQDAVFLYPQQNEDGTYESIPINEGEPERIYGFDLNEADEVNGNELIWTNTKPYVIYGIAAVPAGKTLSINPGARIHFHADSGLMVRPGATLRIGNEGDAPTPENQVIIEGDRLEPGFAEVPGQWLTIWLRNGSTAHSLNNVTIKNATVGILMEGNDGTTETLKLRNAQFYNFANVGILARNGAIRAENVAMNRAGQASLALTFGGDYNFTHCTIANYFNTFNQFPLLLTDYQELPDSTEVTDLNAQFTNCIFFGSGNYGIRLENLGANVLPPETPPTFNYNFTNCLIKFFDFSNQFEDNVLYQFGSPNYTGSIIAENSNSTSPKADFEDTSNNNLKLKITSAAKDSAISSGVATDIEGNSRNGVPDIGAYEYISQ